MTEPDQGRQRDDEPDASTPPPSPPSGWGTGYGGAPVYGGAPQEGAPGPEAAGRGAGGSGAPQYGAPPSGPPQYGGPQYGGPQYGAPRYGPPQSGHPQYGPPQYGAPQYGAPQYGAPQYGPGQAGPGAPGGYRPPPVQRGIVPLRPLGLGEILDGAFRSIRDNPRVMFGFSAVVVSIAVLLQTALQWYSYGFLGSSLEAPVSQDAEMLVGDFVGAAGGGLLAGVVTVVATTVLTGLLIVSVSRSVIGVRVTLAEAWARARPQLWRLLALTVIVLLLLACVPVLWAGVLVGLAAAEQFGAVVVVAVLGGLGALAWLLWIAVRTLLATPALMLEEQKVVAGLKRGWALSRGSFWRLLGIYLLASVIVGTVASFIILPATVLVAVLGLNPLSDPLALGINAVATIIASVLTTPFTAAVVALLYIDLRIRREGLDVDLARAAETAAAGSSGAPRS